MADIDLYDPKLYINRELSWLEFNKRCLREAENPETPLLERVKFLAICYGNMDEFFMIRVPGLVTKTIVRNSTMLMPDYRDEDEILKAVSDTVRELNKGYESCWRRIRKDLAAVGLRVNRISDLSDAQRSWVRNFYKTRIHALLTPLAFDVSHPFPFISSNSVNLAVHMHNTEGEALYARVKVPLGQFSRFIRVPSDGPGTDYVLLEDIVRDSISDLFPGFAIDGVYCFSVTRNADVKVTIDEACDLMSAVEESLEGRDTGFPVRFIVESTIPKALMKVFNSNLKLQPVQITYAKEPIALVSLWDLAALDIPSLKDKPFSPYIPPELGEDADIFASIREKDWILFHPYESFGTIVHFIRSAAVDPKVQSIKICLYRIGKDPSIYQALKIAREQGKTVSVLMELRAKFDENRNIQWARDLEKIGVHVVFGPVDLKVHSKLLQVVRLEGDSLVRYTHMSSGNYNVSTAKQYGDISFLTANQEIGEDVGELFNALTGYFGPRTYRHLLVAPITLKKGLITRIDREIQSHKEHGNGHIVMKANGLIDADIIASLYRASIAGVKVDLNIRGLCCLIPGVPGISENIRVISIVDRFLEHSRIYYFENNGEPEMLMGSSDMMPRNLVARVEVLFPILDRRMLESVRENILKAHFADNVKALELRPDGSYVPVGRRGGKKPFRSQQWFLENRGIWHV